MKTITENSLANGFISLVAVGWSYNANVPRGGVVQAVIRLASAECVRIFT